MSHIPSNLALGLRGDASLKLQRCLLKDSSACMLLLALTGDAQLLAAVIAENMGLQASDGVACFKCRYWLVETFTNGSTATGLARNFSGCSSCAYIVIRNIAAPLSFYKPHLLALLSMSWVKQSWRTCLPNFTMSTREPFHQDTLPHSLTLPKRSLPAAAATRLDRPRRE